MPSTPDTSPPTKRFRIAFSFAGEKREFVEQTAKLLADRFGVRRVALSSIVLFSLSFMAFGLNPGSITLFYLNWAVMAVVGAEYVLKLLPKGTHDYAKFIKPSELSRYVRNAGLDVEELIGMRYNPFTQIYALGRDTDVNYLMRTRRNG